jgi:hypothetical protein
MIENFTVMFGIPAVCDAFILIHDKNDAPLFNDMTEL